MIKDGTYRDKLSEYLSTMSYDGHENGPGYPSVVLMRNPDRFSFQQLFQKELTPSDVGKPNRLVIPRKYAIKFFPRISRRAKVAGSGTEGMQLVFYDRGDEVVELPVLLLEQQPQLRVHQGVETLREGQGAELGGRGWGSTGACAMTRGGKERLSV